MNYHAFTQKEITVEIVGLYLLGYYGACYF